MATLLEMTAEIVKAHAGASKLTSDELLGDLVKVYAALQGLVLGPSMGNEEKPRPALTVKQAFKKDEVICMVCGKAGMKMLTRHLNIVHGMKPREYRKQFGIPKTQSLSAASLTEAKRESALVLVDRLVNPDSVMLRT